MTKYSEKLAREVEDLVAENGLIFYGGAMMKDFLEYFGISYNCNKRWRKGHPLYDAAIKAGQEKFKQKVSIKLVASLAKAAQGYTVEEESEVTRYIPDGNGNPTIREMTKTKTKRYIKPEVGAAIFLLTNADPEHYQNKMKNDISIRDADEHEMTLAEIEAELERLSKLDVKKEDGLHN